MKRDGVGSRVVLPCTPVLIRSAHSVKCSFRSTLTSVVSGSVKGGTGRVGVQFGSASPRCVTIVSSTYNVGCSRLVATVQCKDGDSRSMESRGSLKQFNLKLGVTSLSRYQYLAMVAGRGGGVCTTR